MMHPVVSRHHGSGLELHGRDPSCSLAWCCSLCAPACWGVSAEKGVMLHKEVLRVYEGAQAHLLRIVDPMIGQPLTMDRIEDEASILFVAGARLP